MSPEGVAKVISWFEATLGAESDKVSLNVRTFAASTNCRDGSPIDQKRMVMVTVAAIAWSIENEFDVLCILYVV